MSRAAEESSRLKKPDATGTGQVYGRSSIPDRSGPVPSAPVHAGEAPPPDELPSDEGGRQSGRRPPRTARRAIVLAFLIVVGFTGASVGYSLLQPTVYGARAEFILTPRPDLSDTSFDREMVTQTMIVQSDSVLGPVATKAGMPLNRLRDGVTAEIVGRSNILRLTVGNRDWARAVRLVQLISTEYLRVSGAGTASSAGDRARAVTPSVLTAPSPLDGPLQPQPLRALAAGILLGLLAAAAAVAMMMRSRHPTRPTPHWE